jgi:oxygen-independent coproporphyrinogen-3 oxidase
MSFGIYIHWPYCSRLCPYCDFNVYRARGRDEAPLLQAIIADMKGHAAKLGARTAETLFLGGGTPSLLSPCAIEALIGAARAHFNLREDAEITLEANPDERAGFAAFRAAGINRFSIGVQALRDGDLRALGRTHDAAAGRAAAEAAARTGARVSLDLIYARAGQRIEDWAGELREALALPAEHYSLYQLTIAPRTAFARAAARGALATPSGDEAARFYEVTQEICAAAGAPAYEISNHARTEAARARHNLIYWRGGEWLGLGPGAHGRATIGGERWATAAHDRPDAYSEAVNATGVGWARAEILSAEEAAEEALVMGLRTEEGVARALVAGIIDEAKARDLAAQGFLRAGPERLALTARGRLLADRIAADLLR